MEALVSFHKITPWFAKSRAGNLGTIYTFINTLYRFLELSVKGKALDFSRVINPGQEDNQMMDIIQKFLGAGAETEISEKSNHKQLRILVATSALLMEMAHIDGNFSDKEREAISMLLEKEYHLDSATIQEITRQAERELHESHDLWQFTHLINENFSREEKQRIIEMVWEVIYMDGKLDKHEDYLVHKIARLLNLQHSELIDAKLSVLYREDSE